MNSIRERTGSEQRAATDRLRIAMVAACPFPCPRGTPIRILRLAEALVRAGHEVHIVAYHLGEKDQQLPMTVHRIRDVSFYRKCSPGPTYLKLALLDPLLAIKLRRVLNETEVDLIHAHHYEGLIVASAARAGTGLPLIYDAHTLLELELPYYAGLGLSGRAKRSVGRRLDRWIPRWADHVIAVTDVIRNKLIDMAKLPPEDVTVVSSGIERDFFRTEQSNNGERQSRGHRTLIFTGNLSAYQGIDLLLEAFSHVIAERQDVRLRLVTDSAFSSYESLARRLGVREYIDIVESELENLPRELANSDVALNPRTECDGIPQKLLNYMAAGRAIVSFRGSAATTEHGRTGWVVENNDTAGFAQGILKLLDDPELAGELGQNALRHVVAEHTWEKKASEVEAVYRAVLSKAAHDRRR